MYSPNALQKLMLQNHQFMEGVNLLVLDGKREFEHASSGAKGYYQFHGANPLVANSIFQELHFNSNQDARTILKAWLGCDRFRRVQQAYQDRRIRPNDFVASLMVIMDAEKRFFQSAMLSVCADRVDAANNRSCSSVRFSDLSSEDSIRLWMRGLASFNIAP